MANDSLPLDYNVLQVYLNDLDLVIGESKRAAEAYGKFRLGSKGMPMAYRQNMAWAERVNSSIVFSLKRFRSWAQEYVELQRESITPSEVVSLRNTLSQDLSILMEVSTEKVRSQPKNLHWEQEFYRIELLVQTYYVSFLDDVLNIEPLKSITSS